MANSILSPEVTDVLRRSTITGNVLVLPPEQLDRKLYDAVNKALINAGGKWTRGKGHAFSSDPRAKLGLMLEAGVSVDEKKKFQAFYTPAILAARVIELADVSGKCVLEPSAGVGALIKESFAQGAEHVSAVELNPETFLKLGDIDAPPMDKPGVRFAAYEADFLALTMRHLPAFDRVVMNPPFTKGQDIKHVAHAYQFLRPGGRLVAIMAPTSITKPAFARAFPKGLGPTKIEPVPAGAFRESGTDIATVIIVIDKPGSPLQSRT